MTQLLNVAVIGAAGYAGGELLRLLYDHPHIRDVQAISQSQAGLTVGTVHDDMLPYSNRTFAAGLKACDLVFLCGDHGQTRRLLDEHDVLRKAPRVIDLSHDFRDGTEGFTYGLSEVYREQIGTSTRIANPGCFATTIQLALAPLAKQGLLTDTVHITALTGSTGAGQKLQRTSHFSQRSQNLSTYKVFEHQHLAEIERTLVALQGDEKKAPPLLFVPLRAPFTRGILASLYTKIDQTQDELDEIFRGFYEGSAFVHVQKEELGLKTVINTNQARLHVEKHEGEGLVHIVCCLDNLLKGASGQAVQNMNIMMGWPEDSGLRLKPVVY